MTDPSTAPSALSFPRETFAKLSPGPFLLAHLKPASTRTPPVRPNGRAPLDFRQPQINTGSLSHSNGSAVVRVGDTAVVCGVRAEILRAQDVPQPYRPNVVGEGEGRGVQRDDEREDAREVEELGLLVPNLELSTGCSPQHLPGNAPSTQAQSLSQRILSLLYVSRLIRASDLRIQYHEPATDDDLPDAPPRIVTKAYWTLYIDILVMSLDGNAFDAAWAAVVAALRDTRLPRAEWTPDLETAICSPLASDASRLNLRGLPIASTFRVFNTESHMKSRSEAESWVLADPDGFEEELCRESVTVVVSQGNEGMAGRGGVMSLEKSGGVVVGRERMRELVELAMGRWVEWEAALKGVDT